MYTKEEVVEMFRQMQRETRQRYQMISQIWMVEDLLGEKIAELGDESIDYQLK